LAATAIKVATNRRDKKHAEAVVGNVDSDVWQSQVSLQPAETAAGDFKENAAEPGALEFVVSGQATRDATSETKRNDHPSSAQDRKGLNRGMRDDCVNRGAAP